MSKRIVKVLLFSFFGVLILYFIISAGITFFKISPFLNNLFETADRIERNQQITDSVLVLVDLVQNKKTIVEFKKNEKVLLHFWSIRDKKYLAEISWIEKNSSKNIYVIINDNIKEAKLFLDKNSFSFQVYYCDTILLPFKYRKLIYPYTIEIVDDLILNSFIGNIKKINKKWKKF